ncbi:LEC14B protein, partial [Tanacetum coccineum]
MRRSRKSPVNKCGQASGSGGGVGVGAAADEGLAEIGVATNLRSKPHRHFSHVLPGKSECANVSPVKMLVGRECNYSGRSRFSSADRCHVSSRYLPVNGPSVIDRMNSCAYVSQFSADGTLFVAGFQDSDIKIYSVDNGWQVRKNIRARSLRWTITDTSLSPDQRFLVYSSMSPIVHIVNIESAMTESVANVT